MGERCVRNAEVMGSNPTRSTMKKALARASAFFNKIRPTGGFYFTMRGSALFHISSLARKYFTSGDSRIFH